MVNQILTIYFQDLIEKVEETYEPETVEEKKESVNVFEKSILDIQNQISAIRELPLQIQNHISLLEKQLSDLLSHKIKETEISETNKENVVDEDDQHKADGLKEEIVEDNSQEVFDDGIFETTIDEITEDVQETESNLIAEENFNKDVEDKESSTGRPVYPLTPLPRPIVLPGGRKWRSPKDAYNEKFIAETLISQAEVLVGSTLG